MKTLKADDGNLTIPQELREKLGISSQTALNLYEENGRIIIDKVLEDDPVSRVMGCLKSDLSTDEMMAFIRGPV